MSVVGVPLGVALVAATQLSPGVAVVAGGVTAAALLAVRKLQNDPLVLRVRDRRLEVGHVRKKAVRFASSLDDLVDVRLDTKEVRRLQEGAHAVSGVRFDDTRTVSTTEHGRVVLVRRVDGQRAEHPLMKDYVAHMEASEWLGKVRVFLRKHGWVPNDEREDAVPESEIPESEDA